MAISVERRIPASKNRLERRSKRRPVPSEPLQTLHLGIDCPQFLPYLGETLVSLRVPHLVEQCAPRALKLSLAFSHWIFPSRLSGSGEVDANRMIRRDARRGGHLARRVHRSNARASLNLGMTPDFGANRSGLGRRTHHMLRLVFFFGTWNAF